MSARLLIVAVAASCVACAARTGPPLPEPFSSRVAIVPESTDQFLMNLEFWRTRFGLSECMSDTTDSGVTARVSLVTLDLFVSPYGSVDSVAATSARATPRMLDCVRQVVRTWSLGEYPFPRRYRFTLPMSSRLATLDIGGPVDAAAPVDRRISTGVMLMLNASAPALSECYLSARPVVDPMGEGAGVAGTVVVRFRANFDGSVSDVEVVESTNSATGIDSCLVRAVGEWRLPFSEGGVFEFPMSFTPQNGRAALGDESGP